MPPSLGVLRLVRTARLCILRQLQLEEALLRADPGCWCLLNDGAQQPAAVLGLSGAPERWLAPAAAAALPVYRRFTGGGTVVVDGDTLFASLVLSQAAAGVPCYPAPLMAWSGRLYDGVFRGLPSFELRENDYVLGELKVGGNAQCITRQRFVHHTSFLWDWQPHRMALLQHPPRAPEYREARRRPLPSLAVRALTRPTQGREHAKFVGRLRDVLPDRGVLFDAVVRELGWAGFDVVETPLAEAERVLLRPHYSGSRVVSLPG